MAIDIMKKLTVVCENAAAQRLMKTLHGLGVVQLTDALAQHEAAAGVLERDEQSTEEWDTDLQKLHLIFGLLDVFAAEKRSFVAGLASVPLIIEQAELDTGIGYAELETLYVEALQLDGVYRQAERRIGEVEAQLAELAPLEELPFAIDEMSMSERVRMMLGMMRSQSIAELAQDAEAVKTLAWELVVPGHCLRKGSESAAAEWEATHSDEPRWVLAAFLKEDTEAARKCLSSHGFEEITLPQIRGTVRDRVRELNGELAELRQSVAGVGEKVQKLAVNRRRFLVLKALRMNQRDAALARRSCVHGEWTHMLTGYIRERDLPQLTSVLDAEFPSASLLVEDPGPDEDVPVSLTVSRHVRPVQTLVNLFGLPLYKSFDPSPFLMLNFYLFFGICFSDLAYGVSLVLLSYYIMRRTRQYEGVYNFAKLLLFAGFSTMIFGMLLGSWFGDLYEAQYLGEGNPMAKFMGLVSVIDPLEKPVIVLLIALAIGMVNQFYGIALKMYGALKNGDTATAVFDGLLWLIILPGAVIVVSTMFVALPASVLRVGLALFAIGALGLILTQGRSSKGLVARLGTGLVSLYGIVGSYGLTAFIGDTMSYCRLLALGLTTSIVALSFNMMANLLRPIPYVGIVLFILVLIVGHIFNFFISVLGAFVHSMRLIFVEFFGRFYAGGAKPFAPLGFNSREAVLKKAP
ncbi:MAG TPA: hypothetical protein PK468_25315 [Candidatus Hydrogenedentes bacterium]|nr:hypothetical protein [Candidatus Hydrogenedentota bacterium]